MDLSPSQHPPVCIEILMFCRSGGTMAGLSQKENETEFQRNGPCKLCTMVRRTCVQLLISRLKSHKLSALRCKQLGHSQGDSFSFPECSDLNWKRLDFSAGLSRWPKALRRTTALLRVNSRTLNDAADQKKHLILAQELLVLHLSRVCSASLRVVFM